MKSIYIAVVITALTGYSVAAQVTKGGSKKNWEQYSMVYDTIVVQEEVTSAYPSTSRNYFSVSLLSGKGLIGEEQTLYFPESGFAGLGGHDMQKLYQFTYGGYVNWGETNKNLHPAIDMTSNIEITLQLGRPSFESSISDYIIEYGSYYAFGSGYGIGATLKPEYFSAAPNKALESFLIDFGYRLDLLMFGYGESTFHYPNGGSSIITLDDVAMRLDGAFYIGARYKFFGLRYESSNSLANLVTPLVTHNYSDATGSYYEEFDLNVDYKFGKIALMIYF